MAEYRHGLHAVFDLKYHVIWCTKDRYKKFKFDNGTWPPTAPTGIVGVDAQVRDKSVRWTCTIVGRSTTGTRPTLGRLDAEIEHLRDEL
jgi:hypothetical protein